MVAVVLSACYNKVFLGAVLLKATLKYSNREKHLADLFLPNLSDEVNADTSKDFYRNCVSNCSA